MRILFTRFPLESVFGGAERQTMALAKGLRGKGHTVSFLGSCPVLLKQFQEEGFDVHKCEIGEPPVTKWSAVSFLWRRVGMRQHLLQVVGTKHASSLQRPDAVFMLSLTEKLLLTDWAVSQGIKVFWIEHDRVGRWLTMNPWLPKLRKLSRLVTTVVVSDLSKNIYEHLGWRIEDIVIIPNGVDTQKFASAGQQPIATGQMRLGCIARLSKEKGVDLLVEAVSQCPDVTLTITGKGREEQNIHKLIRGKNLQNRVAIKSEVSSENLFAEMDALVLPSRDHDPFGLVVAEAMAAGIPVILTDACGIASYLHDDEAVIVQANDIQALLDGIRKMQDAHIRNALAKKGPEVAHARFSLEQMVEAYASLLQGKKAHSDA